MNCSRFDVHYFEMVVEKLMFRKKELERFIMLKFLVLQDEKAIFKSVVCYDVSNFKLELDVPEYEFRSLMLGLDYYSKLVKPEVGIKCQG
jgi:hypothetical protein